MSTIFARIIDGEIPCTKIYEDNRCLAFLDIHPITKGHTLLVPKQTYIWMTDVPDDLLAYMFQKAKILMKDMQEKLGAEYVQIHVEGTEVPHFHIHLIPNMIGNPTATWTHVQYTPGEDLEIARKMTS